MNELEDITKYMKNHYLEPNQEMHAHISEQYSEGLTELSMNFSSTTCYI